LGKHQSPCKRCAVSSQETPGQQMFVDIQQQTKQNVKKNNKQRQRQKIRNIKNTMGNKNKKKQTEKNDTGIK